MMNVVILGLLVPYLVCRVPGSEIKVGEGNCTATKPELVTKECNKQVCVTYEWKSVAGTCSVSCGTGKYTIPAISTNQITHPLKECVFYMLQGGNHWRKSG